MGKLSWHERLGRTLAALARARFPKNAICTHHGVGVPGVEKPGIGVTPCGSGVLIMVYDRSRKDGFTAAQFLEYRKRIEVMGEIIDTWNGEPGSDGISLVIDYSPPKGFVRAIGNYHVMPSPFKLRAEDKAGFAAFDKAWAAALKAQGLG